MGAYLEARGRQVEVLFGFLRGDQLALVACGLFLEGSTLDSDPDGVVRCRLAGSPAALVRVSKTWSFDVVTFALGWPRLHAELLELAGPETASALLATAPFLRPLEDMTPLILEHSVRAENLFVLGNGARVRGREDLDTPSTLSFSFSFEGGALGLEYSEESYLRERDRESGTGSASGISVSWKGAPLALSRPEVAPWHDDEVAELAVLGSMRVGTHPEDVVALYASVCDEAFDALEASLAVATVLNLRGVAQRKTGAIDDSVRTLEKAHSMARSLDPQLEQQVAYNLGYALLQTTMKTRALVGAVDGNELAIADYSVDEEHRVRWTRCLELFERASLLDPNDVDATSQVRHVEKLLAVLDGNVELGKSAALAKPSRGKARPSLAEPPAPSDNGKNLWIPMGIVVLVVMATFVLHSRSADRPRAQEPVARTTVAPSAHVPSARERSEVARRAALASVVGEGLPDAGSSPCTLTVEPPKPVPRGEVLAPHFGRAPGTGELYGTDYFDATIRHYTDLFAPELDVRPALKGSVGPVSGAGESPYGRLTVSGYASTLLVSAWHDPVVVAGGTQLTPGRVSARLLVWRYEDSRFVCASEVEATNTAQLVVVRSADLAAPADDPLNRARLDLVEQAYRSAIPRLRALPAEDAGTLGGTGRGDAGR